MRFNAISITSTLLLLVAACAQPMQSGRDLSSTENGRGQHSGSVNDGAQSPQVFTRECALRINNVSNNRLAHFFGVPAVSGLEGPPTFCHEVHGSASNIDLYFMVEYEDHYGIRSAEFTPDNILVGSLSTTPEGNNLLKVIYVDDYGLVMVLASGSSNVLSGVIRYYNFPTYQEALDAALELEREKCRSGQKTVYECLGFSYPTHWWNQPPTQTQQQQVIDMAEAIMYDSSKFRQLGQITLDIGMSSYPQN